ncbi:hypothetical protein HFN63_33130 [Rhizobium leguminosarum]|uniref:hypothetical protein n=1 Tax=Rhizobium leguminosarum TaxID=384 RepID=UPI001C982CA5|nr:hypothetical protein [Rhizobium leguminosarum]MBY5774872.1 hypothetical protein [Rhizobium leguminosarum]
MTDDDTSFRIVFADHIDAYDHDSGASDPTSIGKPFDQEHFDVWVLPESRHRLSVRLKKISGGNILFFGNNGVVGRVAQRTVHETRDGGFDTVSDVLTMTAWYCRGQGQLPTEILALALARKIFDCIYAYSDNLLAPPVIKLELGSRRPLETDDAVRVTEDDERGEMSGFTLRPQSSGGASMEDVE